MEDRIILSQTTAIFCILIAILFRSNGACFDYNGFIHSYGDNWRLLSKSINKISYKFQNPLAYNSYHLNLASSQIFIRTL